MANIAAHPGADTTSDPSAYPPSATCWKVCRSMRKKPLPQFHRAVA